MCCRWTRICAAPRPISSPRRPDTLPFFNKAACEYWGIAIRLPGDCLNPGGETTHGAQVRDLQGQGRRVPGAVQVQLRDDLLDRGLFQQSLGQERDRVDQEERPGRTDRRHHGQLTTAAGRGGPRPARWPWVYR